MYNGQILTKASNEWWKRPADERFLDLEELFAATKARAEASESAVIGHGQLRPVVIEDADGRPLGVETTASISAGHEMLQLTDWSLGQICSRAKVPSRLVRDFAENVPGGAHLMCAILEQGLANLAPRDESMLYVRSDFDAEEAQMMALTGSTYGRIFDYQVVDAVMAANEDGRWKVPAASYTHDDPRRATTLYASDRDVFIFLVNEDNPIEVRTPHGMRSLKRGFFVENSEVGAGVFGLTTFFYDFVCDNRMVWGADGVNELRIRHTSGAPERFKREGRKALDQYVEQTGEETKQRLEKAAEFKVGRSEDDVVDWLRKRGFNTGTSKKIMQKAREEEGGAETAWQLANGLTAMARGIEQTDKRVDAERKVSRILNAKELAA